MKYQEEELLEPVLRKIRFSVGSKHYYGHKRIFDYGCGQKANFYNYLKNSKVTFSEYCGYDPLVKKNVRNSGFYLTNNLSTITGKFDLVVMFAVLEHIDCLYFDATFIKRLTRPGSILVVTSPCPISRLLLETLAQKLRVVSLREINEHKHYYSRKEITSLFQKYKFRTIEAKYFEFGLNNLVVFEREPHH